MEEEEGRRVVTTARGRTLSATSAAAAARRQLASLTLCAPARDELLTLSPRDSPGLFALAKV